MTQKILSIVAIVCVFAAARPALGVAEAKLPVPDIYATSKAVMLGTITKYKAEGGLGIVTVTKVINGEGFNGTFKIAAKMEGLAAKLAVDQPVVLMLSAADEEKVVMHLGDMWVFG